MIDVAHLLSLADAYKSRSDIEDKTLSFRVFNDSKKLSALREGSDITTGRFNAAVAWFATNWPADTGWPANVPRPAQPEREAQ